MKSLVIFKISNSNNTELEVLSKLKSPYIVEFIEYFYCEYTICIIMEYCEVDLSKFLNL